MKRIQLFGLDFNTWVAIVQAPLSLDGQSASCVWYDYKTASHSCIATVCGNHDTSPFPPQPVPNSGPRLCCPIVCAPSWRDKTP